MSERRIAGNSRTPTGRRIARGAHRRIAAAPGASLHRGDPLYVIETDKTTVELEVPSTARCSGGVRASTTSSRSTRRWPWSRGRRASAMWSASPRERLIPPRTRAYARERGLDDHVLSAIPSASNKLMPDDIDTYLDATARTPDSAADARASGDRRPSRVDLPPAAQRYARHSRDACHRRSRGRSQGAAATDDGPRPTPFQVFGHAVARVARTHANFRSVMVGDDRMREYDHVNLGIALARPNDELVIAVVREAERLSLPDFVRACHARMRAAIRDGDQAPRIRRSCSRISANSASSTRCRRWSRRPARYSSWARRPPRDMVRVAVTFDHRLINGARGGMLPVRPGASLGRR